MVPGIYLRHGEEFVEMREQGYETEDLLQVLIADHPEVLAGGDEWVLVKREAGVADREEGSDRWSLDHLLIDADGIPTFVEVKRSSDTRARREVVAQMLDYAANGIAYWNVERLRTWFEAACNEEGDHPTTVLEARLAVTDQDAFWATVYRNLTADRVRLIFVADEIAAELRSIIEYLNRQMTDTEVLAIEVKQYVDDVGERQTIVPTVVGQTEQAKAVKSGGSRTTRQWDRDSLLGEFATLHGNEVASTVRSILDWAEAQTGVRVVYGKGSKEGSAVVRLEDGTASLNALHIWSTDYIEIPFDFMRNQAPFGASREIRDELRRRINEAVPAAALPPEEERIRPNFSLTALGDDRTREQFFGVVEWAIQQARDAQAPAVQSA